MPSSTYTTPPGRRAGWRDLPRIQGDPIGYLEELMDEYGTICLVRLVGNLAVYVINEPSAIAQILPTDNQFSKGRPAQRLKPFLGEGIYTSEGDFHRQQRRLIQPAFHRQRLAAYGQIMTTFTQERSATWSDGEQLDMGAEMSRLTLRIAAKTMLNADLEAQGDRIRSDVLTLLNTYNQYTGNPFAEILLKLPLPATLRFRETRQHLDEMLYALMDERVGQPDQGDVLSMLLTSGEEGASMSRQQIRDEAMTLFMAGAETMSIALSWACYLLSRHTEVVERMRAEIAREVGDRVPTATDYPRLVYCSQVLSEVLRLYPPAYALTRRALTIHDIGTYVLPPNASIVISAYIVHRDPRWWEDPLRFDPDRFALGQRDEEPRYTYFPFGGGPHLCIAEPFARLEGVLVLATLLQQWDFTATTEEVVMPGRYVTLRPDRPIHVKVTRRSPVEISA